MSNVFTEENLAQGTGTDSQRTTGIPEHERWVYQKDSNAPSMERWLATEMVQSGSFVEALGGLGAIALAILAVSNVVPQYLFPVAILTLGVSLAFGSASILLRHGYTPHAAGVSPWASLMFLAGVGGFVLGLLDLVGISPISLSTIALIVLGGGMLLGSGLTLGRWETERKENVQTTHRNYWRVALVTMPVTSLQVLCGCSAIALGILALLGIATGILSAVAIFVLGGSIFLNGAAVSGRLMRI
ncbi:MAG: hypothetical protein JXB10_17020 [Pirellulales bacterium]|nr:hypothetical protein [Pirellulales bacterium]